MKGEKLPIKFFAKREEDNQRVEGGGSRDLPKWVLEGEKLIGKADYLNEELDSITSNINWEKRKSVPVVIKAQISKDALAKTHRGRIKELFTTKRDNIIGMFNDRTLMIKMDSQEDIREVSYKLADSNQFAYAISAIEKIDIFSTRINKNLEVGNYKVKLIDFQDFSYNVAFSKKFEKDLELKDISYDKTQYSDSLIIYKLKNMSNNKLDELNASNTLDSVFEVTPMPRAFLNMDAIEENTKINIKYPIQNENDTVVGVLDNGIERIAELIPWIEGSRMSPYPDSYIEATHGTFVAGIITYGDELQGEELVGANGIKVFDAAVFPNQQKESMDEDELVQNIKEIVRAKCNEIKIWNLSISITREVDNDAFSDFANALDSLQDECNVLICKSAGNCSNFARGLPVGKIHEGADSVRSLVVGSFAKEKNSIDCSEDENPSPFSRIGPGPSYIIKPEICHYGGNAGINQNGKIIPSGVYSFTKNGSVGINAGTSFSTPRVAALAAGLYKEMNEDFDSLLLKALIVHSSSYPDKMVIPTNERTRFAGFGIPPTVSSILYNAPNEATLILRDSVPKSQYIDIKDFPMPDCLIKDGFYTGQIIATLVYDPIISPSQRAEYCQSNMDIRFGSYNVKTERDTKKRNILNPVGREGTQNLLLGSLYSKRKMNENHGEFARKERLLIQYGDKYYPVKKYAVDLGELTETNKLKYATSEKKWYLTLDGVYRNFIEDEAITKGFGLSQDFCLIITIRDPNGNVDVYNGVTQKLDEYNFWHNNIKISESISVRL